MREQTREAGRRTSTNRTRRSRTTSESGLSEGRWLTAPPGGEEIMFQFGTGDQVEVTPAVQEALGNLIKALRGDDVQGFI